MAHSRRIGLVNAVGSEVVHELETDVLTLFDDGLHVAVGLNGRGVSGWVERGNAVEKAVVDGAPFAKTLDGVVFDAGFSVESDFGIDAVELGGS